MASSKNNWRGKELLVPHPYRKVRVDLKLTGGLAIIFVILLVYLMGGNEAKNSQEKVSLSLKSNTVEVPAGELIEVEVILDTLGRQTTGVDVVLNYDPSMLKLLPRKVLNTSIDSAQKKVDVTGTYYTVRDIRYQIMRIESYADLGNGAYPLLIHEKNDANDGRYSLSVASKPSETVSGINQIARLNFKSIKPGITSISLDFERYSPTDSNVAYLGWDLLEKVEGIEVAIR